MPPSKEDNILKLAAGWDETDKELAGNVRDEHGRLHEWTEWASSHAQKDHEVLVCHGRDEWRLATEQSINNLPSISVISWNTLSDTWYEKEKEETYTHTEPHHGTWEARFPRFVEWVKSLRPDVLALQEVDFDKFHSHFLPAFQKIGYEGFMQSQKNQSARQPCGVATFWSTAKLRLPATGAREHSFSR